MKRLIALTTTTAATAILATSAFAADSVADLDLDGDNFASEEEVMLAYPDVSPTSFEDIDMNDDNRLDNGEVTSPEAQRIFDQFMMTPMSMRQNTIVLDRDGDGFIMADDFARAYAEFDGEDFEMIDLNDDNRVSYQEFYAPGATTIVARYNTGTIRGIMQLDTNGDAFADYDEMVAAFPGLPQTEFEEIDLNDDNRISAEELYTGSAQTIVSRY